MAGRYQWAETTRVKARDYLGQGLVLAFRSARDISSVSQLSNTALLKILADMRDKVGGLGGATGHRLPDFHNGFRSGAPAPMALVVAWPGV